MSFRMRPFVGAVIVLGMLLALLSPVTGLAEVVPYEDWQDGVIQSDRWSGGESFGGQEVGREVVTSGLSKELELRYRRQGSTTSDTGSTASDQFLFNTQSADIDGVQATFTVTDLAMTTCAANNAGGVTSARPARLLVEKFNDGTQSVPGNRTGDYHAFVEAFRNGSSANLPGVLNVRGVIIRCNDASCSTSTTIASNTFPTTVMVGQAFTLRIAWDQPNHQFVFGLDNTDTVALPYAPATDVDPANSIFVDIDVRHQTANCTAGAVAIDSTTLVGPVSIILPDPIFGDVPRSNPFFLFIEALSEAGITSGCSIDPPRYCPEATVSRGQMAVFLLRGIHGAGYQPPAATGLFTDVPVTNDPQTTHPFSRWIEQLAREGITAGCGPSIYCPEATVTRGQMAVFLLRAKHGAGYQPPAATGMFADVPVTNDPQTTHPFAAWIEQLAREGITTGCGPSIYCPEATVTRGQMAVFLVRAFNLPI